ncbi:MAG TPA: hypothetical protein VJ785_19605, partial [Anaerolineales bacterium]|nr:hypothetical protein [Anaerolineales bacterium]
MGTSIIGTLVAILFLVGAALSLRAGIRSIQSARTVVFYRTRRARMLAGWQWLAASLVLFFLAAGIVFGGPLV